jgi:pimeloyl-ACP methyl ester carboxylesterase
MVPRQSIKVTSPDGLKISANIIGAANAPAVVLIHGLMQSHLSWTKQVESALAEEFRLVTYDLRGHGASDAPLDSVYYANPERFADELHAVIAAAALERPVLVGWSYGTRVIADYLIKYGTTAVSGINLVAAVLSPNPDHFGTDIAHLARARDEDLVTSIAGTKAFLRACFAEQPPPDEFETMLAYNAMVPVKVRQALRRDGSDAAEVQRVLKSLHVPVLITHGERDLLPKADLARWLATLIPGCALSIYEGVGHSPFFEDPQRFNRELAAFVRRVQAVG